MDKKEYEEIERKANELEHNASIKYRIFTMDISKE